MTAIGLQSHDNLEWPTAAQQDETVTQFEQLGLKVNITELDITVLPHPTSAPAAEVTETPKPDPSLNPYPDGLPSSVQEKLAERYAELFSVFLKHRGSIGRVTFWGLTDADSWRNDWPIRGRTDYPLLFDRDSAPKPAFQAVLRVAAVYDLVSRMTLKEKISQLGHTADATPRLGIPQYDWWNEGLHGVARAGNATVFPQAIGMAAMFDEPLMRQIAGVISTEFRAKYLERVHPDGSTDWYRGLTVWSPNINIFRDPRWGRGQETYGEDPYLTSRLGVAFVSGMQGKCCQIPEDGSDAQAFRGAQRAGIDSAYGGCEGVKTRHGGHVSAGIPSDRNGSQRGVRHARVQLAEWRARLCQP